MQSGIVWNNTLGTGSVAALGQRPGFPPSEFSGAEVSLAVLQFQAAGRFVAASKLRLRVGSTKDPVLLTSTTSSGDDISVLQNVAQVRS